MTGLVSNLLLGVALGTVTSWLGHRSGFLSSSGVAAVLVVSVLIFLSGGWVWGVVSLVFLASTSLWSRLRVAYKRNVSDGFNGDSARNWDQVLARLGWSVGLALFHVLASKSTGVFIAFVGAVAAANADAWATELGVLSRQPPRLITTRRPVSAGTPGGLSVMGIVAALGASWFIGFVGLLLTTAKAWLDKVEWDSALLWLPPAAMIGGIAASLIDSLLGATAQGIYYCEHCDKRTEKRIHECGQVAQQIRGWSWLTNDGINFVGSVVGAAATLGAVTWLAQIGRRW